MVSAISVLRTIALLLLGGSHCWTGSISATALTGGGGTEQHGPLFRVACFWAPPGARERVACGGVFVAAFMTISFALPDFPAAAAGFCADFRPVLLNPDLANATRRLELR